MNSIRPGKVIFLTDIDETLLNTDKSLSKQNRAALDRFLAQGNIFALSTGRAHEGAAILARKLGLYGLERVLISSYNGGLIFDTHAEEVLYHKTVPKELIGEAFDLAKEFGIHIQSYTDTEVVSEADNAALRKYLSIQKLDVIFVDDIRTCGYDTPTKLLIVDFEHPERVAQFRVLFEERFAGRLDCFNSNPYLMEIVAPGVNKGAALRFLAEHYDVPVSNTIAAGDAENDLSMLRAAGIGCAVANATDALKAEADYVTEHDNNHGAVAEILEKFCLR